MMRRIAAIAALLCLPCVVRADFGDEVVPRGDRPFLLVNAERRFTPHEPASLRIVSTRRGQVGVALFRVSDPQALLGLAARRQGTSVAQDALGNEAEMLLRGAVGAHGEHLTYVSSQRVVLSAPRRPRRATSDETAAYDSSEEADEVATWGVSEEAWGTTDVSFGALSSGLYLARVYVGAWAASAMVSVGEIVLVARRGDTGDFVYASTRGGAPQADVGIVRVVSGAREEQRTGAGGVARFAASDAESARFFATRGSDLSYVDVMHARLTPCDPRVYLATGRPTFRRGETVHVRGHVRGCDGDGRYVPLAGERVALGEQTVTSDASGNFVAEVVAEGEIVAVVRGVEHPRSVRIDHRAPPRRALVIRSDRAYAMGGDLVTVTVADEEGGWPHMTVVSLETPYGVETAPIGPARPATFLVRIPPLREASAQARFTASLVSGSTTTFAATEIVVGRVDTLVDLEVDEERAQPGQTIVATLSAHALGGAPRAGAVELAIYATDGNRRRGASAWRRDVALPASGELALPVALPGDGPWWLEVSRGESTASLVVWDRASAHTLGARGDLAIAPVRETVQPGEPLELDLRAPRTGRALVTLEQGGVFTSLLAPAGGGRVTLDVPDRARGAAYAVLTHIDEGHVRTVTHALDIATAREFELDVESDASEYAPNARMHVVLATRAKDGRPVSGVASLWLADAGYWDMGEETYPSPREYLARPGRLASAGDSQSPRGYGAEEGRVLPEASMEWNGHRLDGTTYRHGWGHFGELVTFQTRTALPGVARAAAHAAGLEVGVVCPERARALGAIDLRVRDLPWDLVMQRIADETETTLRREGRTIHFDCEGAYGGGVGTLGGRSAHVAGCGFGTGTSEESRLEGTLAFVGLRRLDASGRVELDLTAPPHPGRYRLEAIVVSDDGGGTSAHEIMRTVEPLAAYLDAPRALRTGDEGAVLLAIEGPGLGGRSVAIEATLPMGMELAEALPPRVQLDDRGRGQIALRLLARDGQGGPIEVRATSGALRARAAMLVDVSPPVTEHPLYVQSIVGQGETTVHVALPELAADATLYVAFDGDLTASVDRQLDELATPWWNLATHRLARLGELAAIASIVPQLPEGDAHRVAIRVESMQQSERAALDALWSSSGQQRLYSQASDDSDLTARALVALGEHAPAAHLADARASLRRASRRRMTAAARAVIAEALALGEEPDRSAARRVIATLREESADISTLLSLLRARAALGLETHSVLESLAARVRARLDSRETRTECAGPAWFLCYRSAGESATLARAARTLITEGHAAGRALAVELAESFPVSPVTRGVAWGSEESELLALRAAIGTGGGPSRFEVEIDGRSLGASGGHVTVPRGARTVLLHFAAQRDRLTSVRIEGHLRVATTASAAGSVRLARRFERLGDAYSLALEIDAPETLEHVRLRAPIPAGLVPGATTSVPGATIAYEDGAVVLAYDRLPRGVTTIALPLLVAGRGTYHAGAAVLETASPRLFGTTAFAELEIPR